MAGEKVKGQGHSVMALAAIKLALLLRLPTISFRCCHDADRGGGLGRGHAELVTDFAHCTRLPKSYVGTQGHRLQSCR